MTEAMQNLGREGEVIAARHLEACGFRFIARNHRTPIGELDIIACDRSHRLFVEVKTQRGMFFGAPAEAVGAHKQRQILRAAQWYMASAHHAQLQPRFDVIAVIVGPDAPAITHIPNVFGI